jgi:hypothetical protein
VNASDSAAYDALLIAEAAILLVIWTRDNLA